MPKPLLLPALIVVVLATVGTVVAVRLIMWLNTDPIPPLLRGISNSPGRVDSGNQFTVRLQKRFPPGSPESQLVGELRREGFIIADGAMPQHRHASFTRIADMVHDICRTDADVIWSASPSKQLINLSGSSSVLCP